MTRAPDETKEERKRRLARDRKRRERALRKVGRRVVPVEVDELALRDWLLARGLIELDQDVDGAVRWAVQDYVDLMLNDE